MIQDIKKCCEETKEISKIVINNIDSQSSQLKNIDSNLKLNEENVKKSNWILRNMTWYGWFLNLFYKVPIETKREEYINKSNIIKPELDITKKNNNSDYIVYGSIAFNKELNEIENNIKQIHDFGIKIGVKLDAQNKSLEELSTKTENIQYKTKKTINKIESLM